MKGFRIIGETVFCFGVLLVILTVAKEALGLEHSIFPHAIGSAIGWVIGDRIIGFIWGKKKEATGN